MNREWSWASAIGTPRKAVRRRVVHRASIGTAGRGDVDAKRLRRARRPSPPRAARHRESEGARPLGRPEALSLPNGGPGQAAPRTRSPPLRWASAIGTPRKAVRRCVVRRASMGTAGCGDVDAKRLRRARRPGPPRAARLGESEGARPLGRPEALSLPNGGPGQAAPRARSPPLRRASAIGTPRKAVRRRVVHRASIGTAGRGDMDAKRLRRARRPGPPRAARHRESEGARPLGRGPGQAAPRPSPLPHQRPVGR